MFDDRFEALSARERRRLLLALHRAEGGTVRPMRTDGDGRRGDVGTDHDHDQLLLWHVHLPKLAALGYVTWHPEANEATRGPRFAEIRPLLRFLTRYENGSDE